MAASIDTIDAYHHPTYICYPVPPLCLPALGIFPFIHKKENTATPHAVLRYETLCEKSCLTDTLYHPTLDNSLNLPRWQWFRKRTVAVM